MATSSQVKRRKKSGELLLEIGTEELPSQFVPPALTALATSAERLLKEHRLTHGLIRTLGTPRRLILIVEALADHQSPAITEVIGPSKAVAFDSAGQPTRAAIGFAHSQQVKVEDLEIRQTPRGEYVCAVKRDPGRPALAVLTAILPALIQTLTFPKSMRWNETGMRFARPIRWLLALYNGRTIKFEIGGVVAGNRTWGHRFMGPGAGARKGFPASDVKSYFNLLAQHGVEPDPAKRRALIVAQLERLAGSVGGILALDEDLLEQAVYSVEYPWAILGSFNAEYLSVPKEVLVTAMKEHQGYFPLMHRDGSLLPAFIAVTNVKLRDMRLIREGNERVLAARLADARFFFDEDRKVKLVDRVEKLKSVVFHQKLGTLYEKTQRMVELAGRLADMLEYADTAACRRAALLSKADLVTGMVGEFPSLQGVMGGEYARYDGEPEPVVRAIREQYLPRGMEGELPETLPGKILALADRLDTIAGFFSVGLVPTGSEDPLGLRRHAAGVVRLIIEGRLTLNLAEAVAVAMELVEAQGFRGGRFRSEDQQKSGASHPLGFIAERLRYYGRTVHHLRDDIMDAVLTRAEGGPFDLVDLLARMKALHAITTRPDFDPLMVGFKRAHRLVEKEQWSQAGVDPARFQHPSETQLHKVLTEAEQEVPASLAEGDYGKALEALVRLKPAIDDFFVGVLVNAEDPALRANRLSLLYGVDRLFMSFADFSQIVVQGA